MVRSTLLAVGGLLLGGLAACRSASAADGRAHGERQITSSAVEERLGNEYSEQSTGDHVVLAGILVDAATGKAVTDGAVQVEDGTIEVTVGFGTAHAGSTSRRISRDGPRIAVDRAGRFELRGNPANRLFVRATAPGYAAAVFRLAGGHADAAHALVVRMARAATVEVSVVDEQGMPLVGADVEFSCSAQHLVQGATLRDIYWAPEEPTWTARTDGAGKAMLEGLAPGVPLGSVVRREGFPARVDPGPLVLEAGARRSVHIAWGSGGTVRGTVSDGEDRPRAGLTIWRIAAGDTLNGPDWLDEDDEPAAVARTDERGVFAFHDVPSGPWCIGIAPTGDRADCPARGETVFVSGPGALVELAWKVAPGSLLEGSVVDPSGQPLTDGWVRAVLAGSTLAVETSLETGGRFRFGPLPPGEWILTADPDEDQWTHSPPIRAQAGQRDLVLRVRVAGHVEGRVAGESARSNSETLIALSSVEDESAAWIEAGPRGEFRFAGVAPGSYVVWAMDRAGPVGSSGRIDLSEGESIRVDEIRLAPGARVEAQYAGGWTGADLLIVVDGQAIDAGAVAYGPGASATVPPGEVELRWRESGTGVVSAHRRSLAAGETKRLEWDGKP
jgi:hypothetical protein